MDTTIKRVAEFSSIDESRIHLISSIEKFVEACRRYGDPDWGRYTEKTHAVIVQVDDIPGGPDFHIFMRSPLNEELAGDTRCRLSERGISDLLISQITETSESLVSFLLLHEIGHNRLSHGPSDSYEEKENEADRWALTEFLKLIEKTPNKTPQTRATSGPV